MMKAMRDGAHLRFGVPVSVRRIYSPSWRIAGSLGQNAEAESDISVGISLDRRLEGPQKDQVPPQRTVPALLCHSPHRCLALSLPRLLNSKLLFLEEVNNLGGVCKALRVPLQWPSSPRSSSSAPGPPTSALRVFLFVDPELVSPSVCSALLLEIEAASGQQTPEACMRHVVSHALQAALGEACHAGALQRKLLVRSLPCSPTSVLLCPYHLFPLKPNINTHSLRKIGEKNADEPRKKIKITRTPLLSHVSN